MTTKQATYGMPVAPGALADIAHELSSIQDWRARIENSLEMLHNVLPPDIVALGIKIDGWETFYYPKPEDEDEIEDTLAHHYTILTGQGNLDMAVRVGAETSAPPTIREAAGTPGSFISLPVIGADEIVGVLHVATEIDDAYTVEDISILSIVASQIGSFIKNVQAYSEQVEAREEIEVLEAETQELAESLTYERDTLQTIMESTNAHLAYLDPEFNFIMVNSAYAQGSGYSKEQLVGRNHFDLFPDPENQTIFEKAKDTGEPIEFKAKAFEHPRYPGKEMTYWNWSLIPIKDESGRVQGLVFSLLDVTEEVHARQEIERLRDVAERAYLHERHISDVLQRALVSDVDMELPGFGVFARYQPALEEAQVGGDFYDVFELADGRLAVVMADVSGKGLKAAVHTAMSKYMLRAYAHENPEPANVLQRLNEVIYDYIPEEMFITIFYGVLDPKNRILVCANAGHEEPLVYNSELGKVCPLDVAGRAIGVLPGNGYTQTTLQLTPGDVFLLYTDGIIDARSRGRFFGIEGLSEIFASKAGCDEEQILNEVLDGAISFAENNLQDDAALLVIKAK